MHTGVIRCSVQVLLCSVLCGAHVGFAQRGRVRVNDININYIRSPKFEDTSDSRAKPRDREWLQVRCEYETDDGRGGWIDEVTLEWSVAVVPKSGKPVICKRQVTYVDIADGNHHAVMYIRPGFMRRYYEDRRIGNRDVAVYVEARIPGANPATYEYSKGKMPREWWRYEEPQVVVKQTELLNRMETPFAPLDYDFYEHIKVEPRR